MQGTDCYQTLQGSAPRPPDYCQFHRLLKLRTDGGHARVRELGSIDFLMYLITAV